MSHPARLLILALAAASASSLLWAAGAVAEEQLEEGVEAASEEAAEDWDKEVEEILVTATKREQSIQDVPISMAALSGRMLEDRGLTQFSQLQNFVPNLQILPTTDTRSTSVRIRGIGSTGANAGIDPSVGVFIDGVYQGRAGMSVGDLLDIERVEVLRGPQGTLYGKNTAAGAINVITKRPSYEYDTIAEGLIGNFGGMEFRGAVNMPIVEDTLAARFSGYRVVREGYDTNRFDLSQVNNADKWGVRAKTAWDVSDALSFQLSGDFSWEETRSFVADIITYAGPPSLFVTFNQLAAASGVPLPLADPFDRIVGANDPPSNRVYVGGAAIDTLLDWKEHSVRWLTAYRTYDSDSQFDGDFSIYDAVLAWTMVQLNQVSSELTITSPGGERFEYQAGLFFYFMNMDTLDRNGFGGDWFVAAGSPAFIPNGEAQNLNDNTHRTMSYAGYGEMTMEIVTGLKLTGGLRVTHEEKTREGVSVSNVKVDIPPIFGPDLYRDGTRNVTNLQGKAVLIWHPFEQFSSDVVDDLMLYASFANGFKSGGFNQLRTARSQLSEFDDEKSLSYELGVKSTWIDGRLTVNLTGFFTDYDDFQSQIFTGTTINVRNAGQLYSYGIETEITWLTPIDGWVIGALGGWNIAEYKEFLQAENTVPNVNACQAAGGLDCTQNLSGKRLDNAPRLTATLFTQYERDVPRLPIVWYGRADYSFTSQVYLSQDLDPALQQPATNLLNLRMGLRADDSLWDLAVWCENVTGEEWLVAGFDVPIVSGYAGVNGPPRRYGVTMRVKF